MWLIQQPRNTWDRLDVITSHVDAYRKENNLRRNPALVRLLRDLFFPYCGFLTWDRQHKGALLQESALLASLIFITPL
jgi:hypothetical protein